MARSPSKTRKPSRPPSRPRPTPRERGARAQPTSASTSSRWALLGGLVAAIAVLIGVLAFSGAFSGGDDGAAPVELGHVHGLGVDPASGDLYAGSHYGLIRLPGQGEPSRVGEVQDFMGFTVAGPNRFLASGHPGEDQEGPSNVGLIESTDGGRSWQTLSLAGQADFHALAARHGLVYGSNAGQLMVSADGRTWDTRASLPMADLTVSPEDPQTLLATTQEGLARSTDGGRSFQLVAGAPLLQLVTWTDTGTLIGVHPEGTLHVSSDGGATWERRGSVAGAPQALTATVDEVFVAVGDGIVASSDGGRTFQTRYEAG
jgi:photosystem II stability/assembly factor-like uncharacterized protein